MPRGASPKREREYDELKDRFKKEGRYKGREKEVAARIVNKQRREYGETKEEKKKDREGKSPDRGLPADRYQNKTMAQIRKHLKELSPQELQRVKTYEESHKKRKTLLQDIDRLLAAQ